MGGNVSGEMKGEQLGSRSWFQIRGALRHEIQRIERDDLNIRTSWKISPEL